MLGERLRKKLKENEISQRELSERLGVSAGAVSHWCCGDNKPSVELLEKTAAILGCSIKYLLGVEEVTKELKQNGSGYNDPTAYKAMKAFESKSNRMEYLRGDIFFVNEIKGFMDAEPCAGRPAIIVSNDIGNKYSPNVEVVYLTSQPKKPMPTHVGIVCRTFSTAMCENIDTVSKNRLGDYIRSLKENEMKAIDNAIAISLGIQKGEQTENDGSKEFEEIEKKYKEALVEMRSRNETLSDAVMKREREIGVLKAELEGTKKKVQELQEANDGLQAMSSIGFTDPQEVAVLKAQLEIYKQQNEMMFNRLVGA